MATSNWVSLAAIGAIAFGVMGSSTSRVLYKEVVNPDTKFDKALAFTLKWEGTCTNHPNDSGGKTYKGITWREVPGRDVCQLSDVEVKQIYYEKYWQKFRCDRYPFPLSTVCFDSFVNFSPSTARSFLEKLESSDAVNSAIAATRRRMNFRYQRVKEKADQSVFLQGWLNRDADATQRSRLWMNQSDYSDRYGSNWDEIAWATRQMTGDRCCGCAQKAELTHHCYYAWDIRQGANILFVPLVGQEQPGVQIFPLCRKCHEIVHMRKNWYHYRPCPVWGNRNYPAVILELRQRFLLLKSNLVGI